ncbi:MAG: AI-2E family transporter [Pseudomonadota bacterium]|jgi:predicted PurR-regulated permease PerM
MLRDRESFLPPRWVLTVAAAAAVIWLVVALKELFVLLVIGYFVAYAIDPIVSKIEAQGLSRTISFALLCVAVLVVLALVGVTAVPTLVDEFGKLSANLNSYIQTSRDKLGPFLERMKGYLPDSISAGINLDDIKGSVLSMASSVSGDTLKNIGRGVLTTLLSGYSGALALFNLLLLPFIIFYIAVDLPQIHGFFRGLFPIAKRSKVDRICGEIDGYVSSFVRGQAIVCTVLFVLYAIGLGVVGVDLWLLLAAITGFGNMVPYVGTVIGLFLSCIMAVVTFGDVAHVVWVLAVFGIVQFLEGMVITPRIMGESVGLSPLVIMLSLFAGGQLFGLLGIFMAIPAAATLRVLVRHSYRWAVHS